MLDIFKTLIKVRKFIKQNKDTIQEMKEAVMLIKLELETVIEYLKKVKAYYEDIKKVVRDKNV